MKCFISSFLVFTVIIDMAAAGFMEDMMAKFQKNTILTPLSSFNTNTLPKVNFNTAWPTMTPIKSSFDEEWFKAPKLDGSKASVQTSSSNHKSSHSESSSSNTSSSTNNGTPVVTSVSSGSSDGFHQDSLCEKIQKSQSFCEVKATRDFKNNTDCFQAKYYKKLVADGVKDPLNGVEKCTKTDCGTTNPIELDCQVAFGPNYSNITSPTTFPGTASL